MNKFFSIKKIKEFGNNVVYSIYVNRVDFDKLSELSGFYKMVFSILERERKDFESNRKLSSKNRIDVTEVRKTYKSIENILDVTLSHNDGLELIEFSETMPLSGFDFYSIRLVFHRESLIAMETRDLITKLKLEEI
ncbi:hypothetical protein Bp8pS_111 [Bacillus phage vB_BpuM-BpSp]|nr:hypothetical protein Bp8pS_111 [Bacillus phage vB_BpuM-BpSp]